MDHIGPARLRALLDAVLTVASDLELSRVLHRIVQAAADLADARYGALGVLNDDGTEITEFLTVGIDDDTVSKIGNLPRGHGILGLLIVDPEPLRLPDINEHPESYGFPPNHPPMASFIGVPIRLHNRVFGNIYLTNKRAAEEFSDIDEEVVITLASAAAIAIENARLHAQVESLAILGDRERIARDLHDTVIQRLFATGLSLQAAAQIAPVEVASRISTAVDQMDAIIREVRSAIFHLEESATAPGICTTITGLVDEVGRMLGFSPTVNLDAELEEIDLPSDARHALVSTLREALSNVTRHAHARAVDVTVRVTDEDVVLTVADDGDGISPSGAAGGKGLSNATARAEQLGGSLTIGDRPGGGTVLEWWIPRKTSA